ncbi:MAG: hypothetical protein K0S49_2169 [Microbacterium sp.]|nr:hypothetical protein [Microbacterium sp.]MDF2919122.1 hypothetical protein [Microbacterium sp.]
MVRSVDDMTKTRLPRDLPPGAAALGMAAILLTLSGCAAIETVAYGSVESTYETAKELAQARGEAPAWLPADARELTRVVSTRAEAESIVFSSDTGLAADCAEVERLSAPTMEITSGPDVYAIDRVAVCGEWAVAENDGTYYAWTPATEAE